MTVKIASIVNSSEIMKTSVPICMSCSLAVSSQLCGAEKGELLKIEPQLDFV